MPGLLLISVGNSRTRLAVVRDGALQPSRVLENADLVALKAGALEMARTLPPPDSVVLLASVNDPVADPVTQALTQGRGSSGEPDSPPPRFVRLGSVLQPPITINVDADTRVGIDRLLAALAAFARSGEACVVIDAGTAVTVDFVDGRGVFQGGCIAPGLGLMLRALHEHTAALPPVPPPRTAPAPGTEGETLALGKNTADAMTRGCIAAVQGLVHLLVDRYAALNNQYPRVIATGGDAPLLFEHDEFVEHIVPDLVLMGMLETWNRSVGVPADV